jgi:predicted hotdog family 3-hydroxylacyl-ACP dehydratase
MSLTVPDKAILTNSLLQYVPHRPPMLWLDSVVSYDDHDGECSIVLQAAGAYMDENGLRPTACIEFIAQASGFITICFNAFGGGKNSGVLKRAFLAGVKDAILPTREVLDTIKAGDELRVRIHRSKLMGPISVIEGAVLKDDTVIFTAGLKVFSET